MRAQVKRQIWQHDGQLFTQMVKDTLVEYERDQNKDMDAMGVRIQPQIAPRKRREKR